MKPQKFIFQLHRLGFGLLFFSLLEAFDMKQLTALVSPRAVVTK